MPDEDRLRVGDHVVVMPRSLNIRGVVVEVAADSYRVWFHAPGGRNSPPSKYANWFPLECVHLDVELMLIKEAEGDDV